MQIRSSYSPAQNLQRCPLPLEESPHLLTTQGFAGPFSPHISPTPATRASPAHFSNSLGSFPPQDTYPCWSLCLAFPSISYLHGCSVNSKPPSQGGP